MVEFLGIFIYLIAWTLILGSIACFVFNAIETNELEKLKAKIRKIERAKRKQIESYEKIVFLSQIKAS